jgi:hypothetical protein
MRIFAHSQNIRKPYKSQVWQYQYIDSRAGFLESSILLKKSPFQIILNLKTDDPWALMTC